MGMKKYLIDKFFEGHPQKNVFFYSNTWLIMLVVVKAILSFTFVGIAVRVVVSFIRKSKQLGAEGRYNEVESASSNFK